MQSELINFSPNIIIVSSYVVLLQKMFAFFMQFAYLTQYLKSTESIVVD